MPRKLVQQRRNEVATVALTKDEFAMLDTVVAARNEMGREGRAETRSSFLRDLFIAYLNTTPSI